MTDLDRGRTEKARGRIMQHQRGRRPVKREVTQPPARRLGECGRGVGIAECSTGHVHDERSAITVLANNRDGEGCWIAELNPHVTSKALSRSSK
jgi:hypothetical protein